jgi:proton-translocating NADH-quinone oxidoreductase chain M
MTETSFFLLAATFLPLLSSPVAYFLVSRKGGSVNSVTWFSFGVLMISTLLLFIPALTLKGGQSAYVESYPWSQFGNFGLRLDGLSLPFALVIYILCTVLALYSKPYMIHKIMEDAQERFSGGGSTGMGHPASTRKAHGGGGGDIDEHSFSEGIVHSDSGGIRGPGAKKIESSGSSQQAAASVVDLERYVNKQMGLYFALFLTFSMGMLGTVLATNLIEFFVFFELMLVPSFFLVAFYGYGARLRIALMFFFWTHVGAVVLLLGLLAMGFFAGGFDFTTVKANAAKIPAQWLSIIIFAIVLGLGVKLAAFLLHIWLPYAHAEAPTPISALLSPAMIGIGAYGLLRLWLDLLTGSYAGYSLYINMWGLATMIYGGAMALMQDDIKRVLAYSSISQMGYILFGIGSESILGITGGTLMYVTHGLGKAILFMMAGSIILQTGTRSMSKLGGLAGKMPYTAVISMIGALTIIGIPPTSGFMAEWILFNGVLQTGIHDMNSLRIAIFGFGILTTVLTSAYILWMYKRIFFGRVPERFVHVKDSNRYITVTMAALAALTLIIGTYPDPILNPITGYIQGIFSHTTKVLPLPTNITTTMTGQFSGNSSTVSTTNSIPGSSIIVGMQQQATDKNIVTSSYHEFVNNIQQKTFMIGALKVAKNIQMQGGIN